MSDGRFWPFTIDLSLEIEYRKLRSMHTDSKKKSKATPPWDETPQVKNGHHSDTRISYVREYMEENVRPG